MLVISLTSLTPIPFARYNENRETDIPETRAKEAECVPGAMVTNKPDNKDQPVTKRCFTIDRSMTFWDSIDAAIDEDRMGNAGLNITSGDTTGTRN